MMIFTRVVVACALFLALSVYTHASDKETLREAIREFDRQLEIERTERLRTQINLKCSGSININRSGTMRDGERRETIFFSVAFNEIAEPNRLFISMPESLLVTFQPNGYLQCNFGDPLIMCSEKRSSVWNERSIESAKQMLTPELLRYLNFNSSSQSEYSLSLNRHTGIMILSLSSVTRSTIDNKYISSINETGRYECLRATRLF